MSKVGEIYQVTYTDFSKYFQFVAIDQTQLNSDVIGVFSYTSDPGVEVYVGEIVGSKVELFTHTTVTAGVRQGLWKKIGSAEVIDYSKALFKEVYYENGLPDIEPYEADVYHSWVIWSINGEWRHIGGDVQKYPDAELGAVFPPSDIVYRIEHGQYEGFPYYGQVR